MTVVELLDRIRSKHHVTQAKIGEMLGKNDRTIRRWVAGSRTSSVESARCMLAIVELALSSGLTTDELINAIFAGEDF